MNANRTILFVINKLGYGGAQKILSFIANELDKRGHTVYIYTFEDSFLHYSLGESVTHIPENDISRKRAIRRFVQIKQIYRVMKEVEPDIVISFLDFPNLLCILASLCSETPLIISERGDPHRGTDIINKFRKFMYRFADGIVFQIEGARDYHCKMIRKKSCIIPNPVIINQSFQPPKQRKKEISFVGRFELKQKRQDLMLLAFQKVVEVHPDITLTFYGDGPDEQKVRNMAKELNIYSNINFAGVVSDVYKNIRESQVFVLTSDYEGIPNALIEAMSVGLPVIATDCSPGGARMLIKDKINGLLVPKGNVNAIAEAIMFLLNDERVAEQYGQKALEVRKKFAPEEIINRWEEYINDVCEKCRHKF